MKRVVVHIDRFALRGFPAAHRDAILAGVRAELARLMAEPGAAEAVAAIGSVPALSAPSLRARQDSTPLQIGTSAARAIGKALMP